MPTTNRSLFAASQSERKTKLTHRAAARGLRVSPMTGNADHRLNTALIPPDEAQRQDKTGLTVNKYRQTL